MHAKWFFWLLQMIIKLFKFCLGELIALAILCLPDLRQKKRPLVLLGEWAGRRSSDNPFHLYEYFSYIGVDCYFVTNVNFQEERVNVVRPWSIKNFWLSLRATHVFYSHDIHDLNPYFITYRSKKINLWHGVGPKCLARDNRHSIIFYPNTFTDKIKAYVFRRKRIVPDLFVVPCKKFIPFYLTAFALSPSQVIELPYARSVVQKQQIKENTERKSLKVLYAPTLRSPLQLITLNEFILNLNECLVQLGLELEVAFHPANVDHFHNNVVVTHNGVSELDFKSYEFCISDYSSIIWDWDMLNIDFLVINLSDWKFHELTREMYFSLSDCLNFSLSSNDELLRWISSWKNGQKRYCKLKEGWGYELLSEPRFYFEEYKRLLT